MVTQKKEEDPTKDTHKTKKNEDQHFLQITAKANTFHKTNKKELLAPVPFEHNFFYRLGRSNKRHRTGSEVLALLQRTLADNQRK